MDTKKKKSSKLTASKKGSVAKKKKLTTKPKRVVKKKIAVDYNGTTPHVVIPIIKKATPSMSLNELQNIAVSMGLQFGGMNKSELINLINNYLPPQRR